MRVTITTNVSKEVVVHF